MLRWVISLKTSGANVLTQDRDLAKLRDEVRDMRRKMMDSHANKSELFDIKHDPGGLIDLEFAVQYMVLAHAHDHPELTGNLGNIALLRIGARAGLLPEGEAIAAGDAYRTLRRLQHGLRLNDALKARVAAGRGNGRARRHQRCVVTPVRRRLGKGVGPGTLEPEGFGPQIPDHAGSNQMHVADSNAVRFRGESSNVEHESAFLPAGRRCHWR
jgi:hypothetical protein